MRTIRKMTKSQRTPTTEIRGLILDASKRIIEEDGYDAFTIRLLSEKADVSPASIYRHIGDKQAVIDAIAGGTIEGITGTFTFDEHHNPVKQTAILCFDGATPVLKEMF